MKIGKVVGHLWSTKKQEALTGMKLMIIEPYDPRRENVDESPVVAVDSIGAGKGDIVIYATGSAARQSVHDTSTPIDAAVLGIVDNIDI